MKTDPRSSQSSTKPSTSPVIHLNHYFSDSLPGPALLDGETILLYVISQREVMETDTTRFLRNFGPDMDLGVAKNLLGNVMFSVEGYDHIDRPIYTFPEICNFYAEIQRRNPLWMFFSEIDSATLRTIWACLVSHDLGGTPNNNCARRGHYTEHLIQFVEECLPAFYALCAKCEISEAEQENRLKKVAQYFAGPPRED